MLNDWSQGAAVSMIEFSCPHLGVRNGKIIPRAKPTISEMAN